MKKLVLLVLILGAFSSKAVAQMYVGVKSGYQFAQPVGVLGTSVSGDESSTVYGSFGAGVPVTVELGYSFSDYFSLQLDATYVSGAETLNSENLNEGSRSESYTQGTQLRVAPQAVFQTPSGFYAKAGLLMPLGGSTTSYTSSPDQSFGPLGTGLESEAVIKGKFSLGLIAGVGYEYQINEHFSAIGEVEYNSLSIKRASVEVTKFDINGEDRLNMYPALTGSPTYIEYEDTTNPEDGNAQGTTAPYSTIGINVGLRYHF